MHHMTACWQTWDLATSCNEILSHRGLFLLHASVGKSSAHTNRGEAAKMALGLCFRGLFTLEHPIGYISSQSYCCMVVPVPESICLFLTTCLEVQNKLKKLLTQKRYVLLK